MITRSLLKNWRLGPAMVLVALLVVSLWSVSYYSERANKAEGRSRQLQSDNSLQGKTIATQAFQFQRANEIGAAANRYDITTDTATLEKKIEYRTILKNHPTCDLAVPSAIASRLLDYTHSLRSRAMPTDTGDADTISSGAIAASTLTYCQAMLWIDPLLAALDKANNKLLAIRQLDDERKR